MVILENSDRNNGYLAVLWRKIYLARPWQNWLSWEIMAERMLILQKSGEKWLFCKILLKKCYLARLWQKMPFRENQGEIRLSSKISAKNCYLVTFWQNERTSCKTLSKMVTLENSDRKNDHLALICRKMVSLVDSGRRKVTSQYSGWMKEVSKKGYLGGFWQKSVISRESTINLFILNDSDRKLFSCKILEEWMVILQDPDKNGYLGKLWQK